MQVLIDLQSKYVMGQNLIIAREEHWKPMSGEWIY